MSSVAQGIAALADTTVVQDRVRVLKQLVHGSMYVIDERTVGDAIVMRASVRAALPDSGFRSGRREPVVRSFRRDRGARSFRLTGTPHLRAQHRTKH
jgi:hypothetical protein